MLHIYRAEVAEPRRRLPGHRLRLERGGEAQGCLGRSAEVVPHRQRRVRLLFHFDYFPLEDRRALPDQMPPILALPRRALVLAVRDGDRADENEIAIFVSGVTANDRPHDVLPCGLKELRASHLSGGICR